MILYLVRHAYAGEHGDPRYPDDSERPLTKKGRKRFRRLVTHLADVDFAPQVIGTSPYLRASQTADVVAEYVGGRPALQVVSTFEPGCDADKVIAWANQTGSERTAYVGHAPDIDEIAAALLGMKDVAIHFAKGAIAAI